jgi:hypothetical protein
MFINEYLVGSTYLIIEQLDKAIDNIEFILGTKMAFLRRTHLSPFGLSIYGGRV